MEWNNDAAEPPQHGEVAGDSKLVTRAETTIAW